ncbi:hypothetical protein BFP72_15985 [Reichenbachiella sp. 5M10]|uniref:hypothetical protein n=1 Tax=Reichenbachiella sp. 5M10 TaxID=1889772 RepID=UPI000C161EF3|nr:hypothetical protein [Reichenbachiella sp. 5M10]PIB36794.1 hypothetical protein BFP72_15985 [Reichenbachiella sp. 5M10]
MKSPLLLFFLTLSVTLPSCLSQEEIVSTDDAQLSLVDSLMALQKEALVGVSIDKKAEINGTQESLHITADSSFLVSEFKLLFSKNFGAVFTNGAYHKTASDQTTTYNRKEGENAGPLQLDLTFDHQGRLASLKIIETRDNYLYQMQNTGRYLFDPITGIIKHYELAGTQKIIGLDPNVYTIRGTLSL